MSATSVGQIGLDLVVNQNQFNKQMAGVQSLAKKTGKMLVAAFGVKQLVNFSKQCIELSSDLQEVQNVADVAFPNMTAKMDAFAQSAAANFGLSETMAKKYSSLYGTMAKQFGFTEESAYNMGTTLAGLAGDVASFYNITQDEAYTKLKSVFSGETETLKDIGVVMTQNALDAYALAKGYNKTTKSMSEAEKVALRYAYVQDQLTAANGDFLRTSDSWANQTRLLKLNLEQLGSVIGGSLINSFKPLIRYLNVAIGKFTEVARAVSDSLGKIFGWEYEENGGISSELESGANSAGNIASGIDDATNSAKKLKQQLRGIDELNVISSSSDFGNGIVSDIASSVNGNQWVQTDSLFKGYESEIDSLGELGERISSKIKDSLGKINWDSVYESSKDFGDGLADFLNGLIQPETFGAVGSTIAGSLNTVIDGATAFGEAYEWGKFGTSLATGLNDFFGNFEFDDLAQGLSIWVDGLFLEISNFIETADTEKVGEAFGTFFSNIDYGKLLLDIITGSISLVNFVDRIEEGFSNGFSKDFDIKKIGESFKNALKNVQWGELAWGVIRGSLRLAGAEAFADFLEELAATFDLKEFWETNIKHWFTKEKWTEMLQGSGESIKEWWTDVKDWWKSSKTLDKVTVSCEDFKEKVRQKWESAKIWWSNKPTLAQITASVIDIKSKLQSAWTTAKNWWNSNVKLSIPKLDFHVTYKKANGVIQKAVVKALNLDGWPSFQFFKDGGFPEDGWFRAKHGEIMGKFDNGKSVVANNMQITDGISNAVYRGNQENNSLMRQEIALLQRQNELLHAILEKEFGITQGEIGRAVRRENQEYFQRTGRGLLEV